VLGKLDTIRTFIETFMLGLPEPVLETMIAHMEASLPPPILRVEEFNVMTDNQKESNAAMQKKKKPDNQTAEKEGKDKTTERVKQNALVRHRRKNRRVKRPKRKHEQ
jgi:hypothetical protein